ncbi:MAG: hypothetical protein J5J06_02205 [Phycisphaerae bacterium]|nr:hypothetical protein [Phycisphaerae bacterium]
MIEATEALRQHQLIILRRLRGGPLTEFELCRQVADHSGYNVEECGDHMTQWLEELRQAGLIWAGKLTNDVDQAIMAAALTKRGKELVA